MIDTLAKSNDVDALERATPLIVSPRTEIPPASTQKSFSVSNHSSIIIYQDTAPP
jgi:hypothetical protein